MASNFLALNPIANLLPAEAWPDEFVPADTLQDLLSNVYFTDYALISLSTGIGFEVRIVITRELSVDIPGLQGTKLVFGGGAGEGMTSFALTAFVNEDGFELRADDIEVALRFPPTILKPVPATPGATTPPYAEIAIKGSISIDHHLDLTVSGFDGLSLAPAMIGDSGIVISAKDVLPSLSRSTVPPQIIAAGFDESFLGVFVTEVQVKLPDGLPALSPDSLIIRNAAIGSGGVTGHLEAAYGFAFDPASKSYSGDGAGTLFGIPFGVGSLSLNVRENAFQSAGLTGEMLLPFFDKRVAVALGIGLDGSLSAKLTGVVDSGDAHDPATGLIVLRKEGLFDIELDSIGFALQGTHFTAHLSGKITPRVTGLDWPSFEVKDLSIDSDGNVALDGGWLDLRDQYSLDFHGFQMEITKLGLGKTDDGGKWIGFSGGLKLVKELPASASVDGLKISWHEDASGAITDIGVTLKEVDVEFEEKGVVAFKGKVAYDDATSQFSGSIKLDLAALQLHVDGSLVVGRRNDESYMALYLAAELPSGIPLWATGLALYGMSGLLALNMEPNKQPEQAWYGVDGNGWYQTGTPGVTDLAKWRQQSGSFAIGAGVTIGTAADNGYRFSGRMLLVIVMPGPIIMIEGKANLLKKRSALDGAEPLFRALAVIDNRADTFLIGIDAVYKYNDNGKLIDIRGSAEAFYDFHDAGAWHIYLGLKDPREKRIRAKILAGLFEADSYFMLESGHLAIGARAGYIKKWKFGPLTVDVEAWIEGNSEISAQPAHLYTDMSLHGSAGLSVWGFEVDLTVDALVSADVFDPYHVVGEFKVKIGLPWPLPDFSKTIHLEWGPEPIAPPLSLPLKEIAIEHFKTTASWPLRRGTLLLPNYDGNADGFLDAPVGPLQPTDLMQAPIVPMDSRPHITFSRPVHDDAQIGINPQPVFPNAQPPGWEWIGDPDKHEGPVRMRSALKEVALEKWSSAIAGWQLVARSPAGAGETSLYGSWAPVPQMPAGGSAPGSAPPTANVKLWLWSRTPFDYTQHSGAEWDDWFTGTHPGYPCLPPPPDIDYCCNFEGMAGATLIASPWRTFEEPRLQLFWLSPDVEQVTILDSPVEGLTHALWFPQAAQVIDRNFIGIVLEAPCKAVKLVLTSKAGVRAVAYDGANNELVAASGGTAADPVIELVAEGIERVVFNPNGDTYLLEVCVTRGIAAADAQLLSDMEQHFRDQLARWSQVGEVLEPRTSYRLRVATTVETQEFPEASFNMLREQTEHAYFRTGGPPGLTTLSVPDGQDAATFDSGLGGLDRYVRQTIPATVPATGQPPVLPRPVYRGYDVGVDFNEDYVDLLYRIDRRDLGLYLYDRNNLPVRDAQGRLLTLANRWGVADTLTLSESDTRWIAVIDAGSCATLDTFVIPHHRTLAFAAPGQLLAPNSSYEARLIPLLLHEDFGGFAVGDVIAGPAGTLNGWMVRDQGPNSGPSRWEIREEGTPPSRHVAQTSEIWGGSFDGADPVKPGTMLLRADDPALAADNSAQPGNWTDYRYSALVRSADDDAVGLVFRHLDDSHYYFYAMDRQRRYHRLVRVIAGVHTVLATDPFAYRLDQDYLIGIEAIGDRLRIYRDGALLFDVVDGSIGRGRIGLYCWGVSGARFSDLVVDDFSRAATPVYRFGFATSLFANLYHHLHSFDDESWSLALDATAMPDATLTELLAVAAPIASAPSEAEDRAYAALVRALLGTAPLPPPEAVEATRLVRNGTPVGLFVHSPEPLDWARTDLLMRRASRLRPPADPPGAIKLSAADPATGAVELLLRETLDLTGQRVELRQLAGPLSDTQTGASIWSDDFGAEDAGLLFAEPFGADALDHYRIVDEGGTQLGPSVWTAADDHIAQTSGLFGGAVEAEVPDKPGTLAVTGSDNWRDLRIDALLRTPDQGAIGIVFRYRDANNHYRFSVDLERGYRRLIKKVGGVVTMLSDDTWTSTAGTALHLVIDAYGDQLRCEMNDVLQYSLHDADLTSGAAGFYCWSNPTARYDGLTVEALTASLILWQPDLADIGQVEIEEAPSGTGDPPMWTVEQGALFQLSAFTAAEGTALHLGTQALGGSLAWEDVQLAVRLRSADDGALGVVFRHVDGEHYYRFSMDKAGDYRRLILRNGGSTVTLWEDLTASYETGTANEVTLRAEGTRLRGYLDGMPLFDLREPTLTHGRVGFYTADKGGARFERVVVTDLARQAGGWTIHDDGDVMAPSSWTIRDGALRQLSTITSSDAATDLAQRGTQAVAGDSGWTDYRLIVAVASGDGAAIGLLFRYRDADNHYRLTLDAQQNVRRLVKKVAGVFSLLWEQAAGFAAGAPLMLTIDAAGGRLRGYLGGEALFDLRDDSHAAGRIGVFCRANDLASFERIEVRRVPLQARALFEDRFAGGDLSGWAIVDEGTVAAPSQWSIADGTLAQTSAIHAPPMEPESLDKRGTLAIAGDPDWADIVLSIRLLSQADGAIGVAFRYTDPDNHYRFSMDVAGGFARLVKVVGGNFTSLWQIKQSTEIGRGYDLQIETRGTRIRGTLDGVPLFVAEDDAHAAGQIALYSWNDPGAVFSEIALYETAVGFDGWLLDDPFDQPLAGRWAFLDQGGDAGPSDWKIEDGALRQHSDIHGGDDAPDVPEKPGTLAVAGAADWDDYGLSVRLRSDDEDGIGVVARFQDADHHYRFSMDSKRGFRRLVRIDGGAATILWEDAAAYELDRDYLLSWRCVGDQHVLHLDGALLVSLTDGAFLQGKVGLYCWANAKARFDDVRVAPLIWTPLYAFGPEPMQSAGMRARLAPGAVGADSTTLLQRSTSAIGTGAATSFDPSGTELRVVGPRGEVGHSRYFLPDTAYGDQEARILRKADGTGFVLLVPDATAAIGALLPEGDYRMQFTYRRDNRAIDPDSIVFSQGGDAGVEQVTLDVPWIVRR